VEAGYHPDEAQIAITTDTDIVQARQLGRALAAQIGCSATDQTMVATAISEIARNILTHAGGGQVSMYLVERRGRRGLEIVATDDGPGIADIDRALQDGFTTGAGLGLGLPGARRLMDELTVSSSPGGGTTVVMVKWCPYPTTAASRP
jgi:serine/threonine-protein kinase RsbT